MVRKDKEDAMHMLSCLMVDAEHDLPRQYDLVHGMREMVQGEPKGEVQ